MNSTAINVVAAQQTGAYCLRLLFDNSTSKDVNFEPFLAHSHHPDIRAVLDPKRFSRFRVQYGELVWGDYELCFPIMDLYHNTLEHKAVPVTA